MYLGVSGPPVNPGRSGSRRDSSSAATGERVLEELFRAHSRVLFAYVLRLVEDHGRAEEVVQETMLRAWQNLDAIDPRRGDPRSYLFTVARNIVIDRWRADRRRPRLVSDDHAVGAQLVGDGVDAQIDAWLVREALTQLSVPHRSVIDELYYRGSTVAETARTLSIPAGTVKSRAYYAVRVLRAALEEMGVLR